MSAVWFEQISIAYRASRWSGSEFHVHFVDVGRHVADGSSFREEPAETFKEYADEYHVLVYDARGSGYSAASPPLSHAMWVQDLEELRKWACAETLILAGGSYGGFIALEYAIRYPHRLRGLVLRDTAATSSGMIDTAIKHAQESPRVHIDTSELRRLLAGRVTSNDDFKALWRAILPLYTYTDDPDAVEEAMKSCIFRFETHNAAFSGDYQHYDVRDKLYLIQCPVLVTVGRADWACTVEMNQLIAQSVQDGTLTVFERSGHSPQVEEKTLWHKRVRGFLRTCR